MMRHDVGRTRDETLGIGPGLGGHRDRFGTERGTSHNSILHFKCTQLIALGS